MRSDLPTGTVTFVFTDVEGSTKLLDEIGEEAYEEALAGHRRTVRAACSAQGGVEVDTQGDAFFFAFPTVPGAVVAASEMTRALASGPVQVRIGMHTGTPRLSDEGYVGKDVHLAARVAASGHGGQVVLSQSTRELLEDGFSLTDLGEHRLKDISEPVVIFQLGDESFPPLKTISNTNLPRPASSFVGRERELSEVLGRIEDGARLLTLTGPGGSGKTRLALETATSLVPEYKAGVFWVGLASLRDASLVPETIAQTLGAKDGLVAHIGERELLLLLDNLEQVIEAAPELSSLLQACPNLALLCTSRELLRVQGEVEYAVPPLALPEAVSLFCERSGLVFSDEIAELCARLDNLPLAVELAAARTKALSPAQILERLSERLDLLKGGRDADPRQQTLRATIEWSYDLLIPAEKQLFARLSVFVGGCTLEAAEEVCDASLDTLQSLVEKSLLRFSNERYWMLETIRGYAREQLEGSGGLSTLGQRRSTYFSTRAEKWSRRLNEAEQRAAFSWFDAEIDNLRAVGSWLLENGADMDFALLSRSLSRYLWRRGLHAEYARWLDQSLALRSLEAEMRIELTLDHVGALLDAGHFDEASSRATDARAKANEAGLRRLGARASYLSSHVALAQGRADDAEALVRDAEAVFHELGEERWCALVYWTLGGIRARKGDYEEALDLYGEALEFHRSATDSLGVAWLLSTIAEAAARAGQHDRALVALDEAFGLYEELGLAVGFIDALRALAELALVREPALAAAVLELCRRFDESGVFELIAEDRERLEELSRRLPENITARSGPASDTSAPTWAHESLSGLLMSQP